MRTIASTGTAQDIAPTSDGVYWLSQPGLISNTGAPVIVYEYDPVSGRVTKAPSTTGFIGSPALTVTGGSVWIVVEVGNSVVVEQLDPTTLASDFRESLPVKDHVGSLPPSPVLPVLTATVDGPLWVAGGEDVWALNPSTGAVETEFDAGNEITSMSTDPTGSLLFTSGRSTGFPMVVTEYDAQTGQQMRQSEQGAIVPGTVAATNGGVWVSARGGNAGGAFELSATGLNEIAPPASEGQGFGTFDQIMGVGSSISERTLWLTSLAASSLTCADPATGAVRASESSQVFTPIARGQQLYAVVWPGTVVVITPPAKCFG